MEQNTLVATTGRGHGSGPSRRIRAENKVPAVIYGQGIEPISITVDRLEFRRVLNSAGSNAVITLDVDGDQKLTFVRDIQIHPIKDRVQHVDFLLVDAKQTVSVEVPIVFVGEAEELAREGGILEQVLNTIAVEAPVVSIPRQYEVDVTNVTVENSIRIADVDLGEGVTTILDLDTPIASGSLPRGAVEDEAEEAEGEAVEGEAASDGEATQADDESSQD